MPVDNPGYCLLRARSRGKSNLDMGLVGAVLGAGLVGLVTGQVSLSAVLFVILYSLMRTGQDSGLLSSLCKGRGIEEVLMTHTGVQEILDGLAYYSLRAALWPCLGVLLWLGLLTAATWNPKLLLLCLVFVPLAAGSLLTCAYLTQLIATGTLGRRGLTTLLALMWLGLLVTLITTLAGEQYAQALAILVALAGVALLARRYTGQLLLERLCPPRQPMTPRSTSSVTVFWGDDAICLREGFRDQRRGLPWGALLVTLWVAAAVVLIQGLGVLMLVLLLPIQSLRAGMRLAGAVVDERQARSFELLGVTMLRSEEFVDGWALYGWRPVALENGLVSLVLFGLLGLLVGFGEAFIWVQAVYYALLGTLCAQLGAYSGLMASSVAGNRESVTRHLAEAFGTALFGLVGGLTLCAALGNFALTVTWPLMFCLLLTDYYRWRTLRTLTVGDYQRPWRHPGALWAFLILTLAGVYLRSLLATGSLVALYTVLCIASVGLTAFQLQRRCPWLPGRMAWGTLLVLGTLMPFAMNF